MQGIKTKLPAVTVKHSRVELFTQWHFRAEFTALVDRFIITVVAEKVYNSTQSYLPLLPIVSTKHSENNACFNDRLMCYRQLNVCFNGLRTSFIHWMSALLQQQNLLYTHWCGSLVACVPIQSYCIWCELQTLLRCICLSSGDRDIWRIPWVVCKSNDIKCNCWLFWLIRFN